MSMAPQVRVGGTWLSSLGWWGEQTVRHRWPYGCWETTWSMNLPTYSRPPALVTGANVDVYFGATPIWSGRLAEPNWDSQEFTAVGHVRDGEQALCLTGAGVTTATPDVAIDAAINRGSVRWVRSAPLSNVTFAEADNTDSLNYLGALLDAWSVEQNKRWAVGADRKVYAAADPTTPTWYVTPGAGVLGVADEDYVTDVYGRYRSTNGAYATARATDTSQGLGTREVGVDLTPLGRISSTKAQNVVNGILAKSKARTGWTNGVTVTADQVTSPGGIPASLATVTAGQMVRLQGLLDQRGIATYTDIVLGETVWDVDEGTLQLNPVGLAERDLRSIVENAGGQLV